MSGPDICEHGTPVNRQCDECTKNAPKLYTESSVLAREALLLREVAEKHVPLIQWDLDGEVYSAKCRCGFKFTLDNLETWRGDWQQHILSLRLDLDAKLAEISHKA